MEQKDLDGNFTGGIGQLHLAYKLLDRVLTQAGPKKLSGPPPRGPIERQLGRYLEKAKQSESSSGSGGE